MHILAEIIERGLQVSASAGRLIVAPADRIDDELRAFIRANKGEIVDALKMWSELETAIHRCCDVRRDSDENRKALLDDAWREPATEWAWLTWYFDQEVASWTH